MISFSEQMQRWGRVADRPLNKFEQMVVGRPFKYSSYWRSWSRVIKPISDGYPIGYIELNITPIFASNETWVNSVQPMIMRNHLTPADKKDLFESELPPVELQALIANVGHEDAMFMLNTDLWPMMDITKFLSAKRGFYAGKAGVPFHEFRLLGTEGMSA